LTGMGVLGAVVGVSVGVSVGVTFGNDVEGVGSGVEAAGLSSAGALGEAGDDNGAMVVQPANRMAAPVASKTLNRWACVIMAPSRRLCPRYPSRRTRPRSCPDRPPRGPCRCQARGRSTVGDGALELPAVAAGPMLVQPAMSAPSATAIAGNATRGRNITASPLGVPGARRRTPPTLVARSAQGTRQRLHRPHKETRADISARASCVSAAARSVVHVVAVVMPGAV